MTEYVYKGYPKLSYFFLEHRTQFLFIDAVAIKVAILLLLSLLQQQFSRDFPVFSDEQVPVL
jgi:hypothetical protein